MWPCALRLLVRFKVNSVDRLPAASRRLLLMGLDRLRRSVANWLIYLRGVAGADRLLLLRRLLLLLNDAAVLALSFWAAFALRFSQVWPPALQQSLALLPVLLLIGVGTLIFSGWYRSLTRTTGSHSLYGLMPRTG